MFFGDDGSQLGSLLIDTGSYKTVAYQTNCDNCDPAALVYDPKKSSTSKPIGDPSEFPVIQLIAAIGLQDMIYLKFIIDRSLQSLWLGLLGQGES